MAETVRCPKCRADQPVGDDRCRSCGEVLPPARRFGIYEVTEPIGQGGMGAVYKAWDPALRRHLAIKTLLPELAAEEESRRRFLREAQSVASLTHPNIIQIFTIAEEAGYPYFAMEHVDGRPLSDMLARGGPLPPLQALDLVSQAARGLQEAHRKGIVHRDIKPANLLITADGTVKITDFGLAKGNQADMSLTFTGIAMGSPNYMSPEQGRGEKVDHRSDVYSLGVTLFEMLTGRLPFEAPTPMAMILKHAREVAPSPKRYNPGVSYPVARVVQRMLSKKPEDRYPDYPALLRELDAAEIVERRGPAPAEPAPPGAARRTPAGFPFFPLAIAFLALISGVLFYARRGGTEPGTPDGRPSPGLEVGPASTPPTPVLRQIGEALGEGSDRPRPRPELRFGENLREVIPGQGVRLYGSVRNEGEESADRVRVRLTAFDEDGNTVGAGEVALRPERLEPGQTGFYELFLAAAIPPASVETEISLQH